MDEERERRRLDLARATRLLHTMSREDMFELLYVILYNQRSDDTRKLSDWMASKIISEKLGRRGGSNEHEVEDSWVASDTTDGDILTISKDKDQGQDDYLEDDSSSTASFMTCPDPESLDCDPGREAVSINTLQMTDGTQDEQPLPTAHDIDDTSSETEETQIDEKVSFDEEDKTFSTSQVKALVVSSDVRHLRDNISQRSTPTTPESRPSDHSSRELKLEESICGSRPNQSAPFAATRQQASGKEGKALTKQEAFRETQRSGHRNLEELYARFDEILMKGWRAYPLVLPTILMKH
ncbi:hypothetical protein Daus18300_012797 [Diaporthe australafricana]|uniref:Uncharacterized protein n=1 Tax=Diaporthe australafricana TaxID=127596 RepID=A0ABR3W1C5_9PEZI